MAGFTLPHDELRPSPYNAARRARFSPADLQGLAESIMEVGILQPIIVRQHPTEPGFEIVAGERRWLAAAIAGLESVPASIKNVSDSDVIQLQLVENLQREDSHPLDECAAFAHLVDQEGLHVQQVADRIGKSIGYVYGRLKLHALEEPIRQALIKDEISTEVATLAARLTPEDQEGLLEFAEWAEGGATVRNVREYLARERFRDLGPATFPKADAELVPGAGACTDCPKRTGNMTGLETDEELTEELCSDDACFVAKSTAFVDRRRAELGAKGEFVELSTRYGTRKEKPRQRGNWWAVTKGGQWKNVGRGSVEAMPKNEAQEIVTGLIVEGDPDALGLSFPVSIKPRKGTRGPLDSYEKQQRDAANKSKKERVIRRAQLAAIAEALPAGLRAEKTERLPLLRRIAIVFFGELWTEKQKWGLVALGVEPAKRKAHGYESIDCLAPWAKLVEKATEVELLAMLGVLTGLADVYNVSKPKDLPGLAEIADVDLTAIRRQHAKPKKKAKKKGGKR